MEDLLSELKQCFWMNIEVNLKGIWMTHKTWHSVKKKKKKKGEESDVQCLIMGLVLFHACDSQSLQQLSECSDSSCMYCKCGYCICQSTHQAQSLRPPESDVPPCLPRPENSHGCHLLSEMLLSPLSVWWGLSYWPVQLLQWHMLENVWGTGTY